MKPVQHEQASRPYERISVEREELTCAFCGLIYPQTVSEFVDQIMHDQCPRCRQVPRDLIDR